MTKGVTIAERLERLSIPEPNSGCHLWLGALSHNGRARIGIMGKNCNAARVTWTEFRGPIPAGMSVCHRCDNGACVNIDHLWLGSHQDNMTDMKNKKRYNIVPAHAACRMRPKIGIRGEAHAQSKLTAAQVLAIRSDTRLCRVIAPEYGLHPNYVAAVRRGAAWKHL